MELLQIAIPERLGTVCAEVATRLAGGATLLSGIGWWINGRGEVEREQIGWLVVGVDESRADEVISAIKEILRSAGESAIFYVRNEPKLEWLQ
jgi:hypothetical protein